MKFPKKIFFFIQIHNYNILYIQLEILWNAIIPEGECAPRMDAIRTRLNPKTQRFHSLSKSTLPSFSGFVFPAADECERFLSVVSMGCVGQFDSLETWQVREVLL